MDGNCLDYRVLGERIRKSREERHYTREQVSELTGLSPKFIYEIEFGRKGFSACTLYRLSRALHISCEYILTGEEERREENISSIFRKFNEEQKAMVKEILLLVYGISGNGQLHKGFTPG